jgi:hypothetical protein
VAALNADPALRQRWRPLSHVEQASEEHGPGALNVVPAQAPEEIASVRNEEHHSRFFDADARVRLVALRGGVAGARRAALIGARNATARSGRRAYAAQAALRQVDRRVAVRDAVAARGLVLGCSR